MTLDELKKEILAEYENVVKGCPPMAAKMCRETLGPFVETIIIGIIHSNRPALEAGMIEQLHLTELAAASSGIEVLAAGANIEEANEIIDDACQMLHEADMRGTLRKPVAVFADAMESKLQRRDAEKGGWDDVSVEWLCLYLETELTELKEALVFRDHDLICEEAVDVANLAMMIHDKSLGLTAEFVEEK
jgi:hypothetical protein